MLRRILLTILAAALLAAGFNVYAQPAGPLPLPADPSLLPAGPVERTPEDIEAIRQMEEAGLRSGQMGTRAISHVVIPSTIRIGIVIDYTNQQTINQTSGNIHCSTWLANDQPVYDVIEMDFREYVKNVLPNEWVHTWHPESLRAGAVAAKMFAWWRVNITEQFPTIRPGGVNVVNNTCDQVFIQNSRRPSTDAAIDMTWPYRLHESGLVREIHYLARDYQCANTGWPRCLPQWTTQDMALAGALWQDMIYQYYSPIEIAVTEDILANTNVLHNGKFDEGTLYWTTAGSAHGVGVADGVFNYYRGSAGGAAALRQEVAALIPNNAKLKMQVKLGNSAATPKHVTVRIVRPDGGAVAGTCTFELAPNQPLLQHIVWGTTPAAWSGVRVEVIGETADNTPAYQVDNVVLKYAPNGKAGTMCLPPLPGKPQIVEPLADTLVDNDFTVLLTEGKSNHRVGYDSAFHIQIDDAAGFASPVFDNFSSMADAPAVFVTLPGGTYYLRARQFDGIDRYSKWSKVVIFSVDPKPDKPTIVGPAGDVASDGQSFTWESGEYTNKFKLVVKNKAGKKIVNMGVPLASAYCAAGSCSVPLNQSGFTKWKTGKPYTWFVKAINPDAKAKSAVSTFTLIPAP